jgi:N-acetylglucosamine-6-sulfatase
MMASVDEGVGELLAALERNGQLDDTFILFLGDNGYFFGEHGLGLERRFAYEEGIRSPFVYRYPRKVAPGTVHDELVLALDIAPTCIELAGGRPGPQIQGRSLVPLMEGRSGRAQGGWRQSIMAEYFSENAMPWLHGMTYKAVRTDRWKYVHWVQKSLAGTECDELYDLREDPYEMRNLIRSKAHAETVARMRRELSRLVASSIGL